MNKNELNKLCVDILRKFVERYIYQCGCNQTKTRLDFLGKNVSYNLIGWSLLLTKDVDMILNIITSSVIEKNLNTEDSKLLHEAMFSYNILKRKDNAFSIILQWSNLR